MCYKICGEFAGQRSADINIDTSINIDMSINIILSYKHTKS
jgi:hypothetical protein